MGVWRGVVGEKWRQLYLNNNKKLFEGKINMQQKEQTNRNMMRNYCLNYCLSIITFLEVKNLKDVVSVSKIIILLKKW